MRQMAQAEGAWCTGVSLFDLLSSAVVLFKPPRTEQILAAKKHPGPWLISKTGCSQKRQTPHDRAQKGVRTFSSFFFFFLFCFLWIA